ncbi:unnamed protein product [Dovyalis caffra]|uniref:Ycf2 n=1 Tax=Dovyalis caffra TaxID=77055 RepID=A0AAV1RJC2_9ROSI|nr:unnamed protein product [Dovyalis caffra]
MRHVFAVQSFKEAISFLGLPIAHTQLTSLIFVNGRLTRSARMFDSSTRDDERVWPWNRRKEKQNNQHWNLGYFEKQHLVIGAEFYLTSAILKLSPEESFLHFWWQTSAM